MNRILVILAFLFSIFLFGFVIEMLIIQNRLASYQETIRAQNSQIQNYKDQILTLNVKFSDCADQLGVFYMPIEEIAKKRNLNHPIP